MTEFSWVALISLFTILLIIYKATRPCRHPYDRLVVRSRATEVIEGDFILADYHLHCCDCGMDLDMKTATCLRARDGF